MSKWVMCHSRLPAPGKPVLVAFGDSEMIDIAEWYITNDGKVGWQQGGFFKQLFPKPRTPIMWRKIPKLKNNTP